jgi:predicted Rossmann fold nucleotide-binding protein DprA/Smf involved in DNA uptake
MSAGDILLPYQSSFPRLKPKRRSQGAGNRHRAEKAASEGEKKREIRASQPLEEEKRVDTEVQADYIDLDAAEFTEEEKTLLLALQKGEKSAEELSAETGLTSPGTLSALTMLTLQGAVEELGGGRFQSLVRLKNKEEQE